jgi:hypothetical protein
MSKKLKFWMRVEQAFIWSAAIAVSLLVAGATRTALSYEHGPRSNDRQEPDHDLRPEGRPHVRR